MMGVREIKFRAWDKANKKMLEVDGINFNEFGFSQYKSAGIACDLPDTELGQIINLSEVELMQYVNKEICVGDITYHRAHNAYAVIAVSDDGWCFVGKEIVNGKYTGDVFYYQKMDEKNLQVIGNIYETPELLEATP